MINNVLSIEAFTLAVKQIENGIKEYYSDRNKKYIPTENVKYFIFNLPCKVTCIGKCKGCEEDCYADKAEKQYPDCLPCRYRNYILTFSKDFVEHVVNYVKGKINNPRTGYFKVLHKKNGKVIFRIHESGDFYNLEYLEKWIEIARQLPEIEFLWYTKSFELFEMIDLATVPENFRRGGNFSVWEDMPEERKSLAYKLAKEWKVRVYTALWATDEEAKKHGCNESLENTKRRYSLCRCEDCATCQICLKGKNLETIVAIH